MLLRCCCCCCFAMVPDREHIWHIQSDLIGGPYNRETNVKQQKQRCCQIWWFLSPSPVLITFILCLLLYSFLFSSVSWHTKRTDETHTHTTFRKCFPSCIRMCIYGFFCSLLFEYYWKREDRSIPRFSFRFLFLFSSFHAFRFSWSHSYSVFRSMFFFVHHYVCLFFWGLSISFHFGTFLDSLFIITIIEPNFKATTPTKHLCMCIVFPFAFNKIENREA